MKPSFFSLITVVALSLSSTVFFSSCTQTRYSITGHISGDADGKTVYLCLGIGSRFTNNDVVDSTVISNGIFEFTGELPSPWLYTLQIVPDESPSLRNTRRPAPRPVIPVFLDYGTTTITANYEDIPTDDLGDKMYDYTKLSIEASKIHDDYVDYMEQKTVLTDKRMKAFMDYITYLNTSPRGSISQGIEAVNEVDALSYDVKLFAMDYIKNNKDNNLGAFVFHDNINRFTTSEIDEITSLLSSKNRSDVRRQEVIEKAATVCISAIGAPYPDYELFDTEENTVNLSEYVGKGKYVLIDFWASWCGPCRADLPHLKEVYKLYHPAGFEIVSVSVDADKAAWLQAVEVEEMAWIQVWEPEGFDNGIAKKYNFSGIPTCILVGPDGTIVDRNMRGSWMDRELIKLYGNLWEEKY